MLADRSGQPAPGDAWTVIAQRLRNRGLTPEDATAIRTLVDCQVERRCRLPDQALLDMLLLASGKEPADAMVLYAFARFAYNRLDDEPLALTLARDAAAVGDPSTSSIWWSSWLRQATGRRRLPSLRDCGAGCVPASSQRRWQGSKDAWIARQQAACGRMRDPTRNARCPWGMTPTKRAATTRLARIWTEA